MDKKEEMCIRDRTLGRGVRHELEDVIAHERLTAAENHDFEAGARDLLDHRPVSYTHLFWQFASGM